jgi:hypothetical protein
MDDPLGEDIPSIPLLCFIQESNILGMPTIFFLGPGLTMGTEPSKIPSEIPLGCLLANLEPLRLSPDLKAQKLIFLSNQAWPQYQLDNDSKWLLNSTLDPNILRDLYNFCERTRK